MLGQPTSFSILLSVIRAAAIVAVFAPLAVVKYQRG
jgi:hypothetical protein